VNNSCRWKEELLETWVSFQNKFEKLVHLVGFIIRKFVTMHGHLNVKTFYSCASVMYIIHQTKSDKDSSLLVSYAMSTQCFPAACCLHLLGIAVREELLWSRPWRWSQHVKILLFDTASHPTRFESSSTLLWECQILHSAGYDVW
jgi:hypothetical protein